MTNEEAIKVLEPFKACMFDQYGCPISDAAIALDVAIEALKQTKWIPCSERLPEPGEYYLVTMQFLGCNGTEYREIDIAEYEYDGWDKANTVLAWCELPKPYEGRTE